MPSDLSTLADPRFILVTWGAGVAVVGGAVTLARIVGPGFVWLVASVAALVGLPAALADGAWAARLGVLLLVLTLIWARSPTIAGSLGLAGGIAFLVEGALLGAWLPALTATLALGGVTGEMMLGHWYLVDPRLPRAALRALGIIGIAGLVVDTGVLAIAGLPGGGATVAYFALMATSIALLVAVIAALRYPAYSGVMAATGLSYLAVLTTLGGVFLGRALVAGVGPFSS